MTDHPERYGDSEEGSSLQAKARLNSIDRELSGLGVTRAVLRWLILPVFWLTMAAMVAGLLLGFGTLGLVVGGIIGIGGAAATFVTFAQRVRDEITELEGERASWIGGLPLAPGRDPDQISSKRGKSGRGNASDQM